MKLTLDHVEQLSNSVRTFWLKPEGRFRYIAGQAAEFSLPHLADGRGNTRWFTLSSSPSEHLVAITTKLPAGKASSFKQALLSLKPGDQVAATEPLGDFVLPKNPDTPLVFVAGGMGITPTRSIVKWLQDTNQKRNITLIYSASNRDKVLFKHLFTSYKNLRLVTVITTETERLTAKKILEMANPPSDCLIYLSGPEQMVEALDKGLQAAGMSKQNIIAEYFSGY